MPRDIINFNSDRPGIRQTPVGVELRMFDNTTVTKVSASTDVLFLSNITVTSTGSGYTSVPTVTLLMSNGSVVNSASVSAAISGSKMTGVQINGSGRFSLDSKISGSVTGGGGSGAKIYIALSKSKRINNFLPKQALYSEYAAAREKLKLVLFTKKGEVARNSELGTRIYEFLFNFSQMDDVILSGDLTQKFSKILADDITQQVPEVEILSIELNDSETEVSKNIVAIKLIVRHRFTSKVFSIDFSAFSGVLRDYYITDDLNQKTVHYLT